MAWKLLALAAVAALAAGLIVGLSPITAYGVECGSALAPDERSAHIEDLSDTFVGQTPRTGMLGGVAAACTDAVNSRRPVAVSLLVVGGVAGFAALVTARGERLRKRRVPGGGQVMGRR